MSSKLNQKMSLYIPRVDTRSLPRVGGNNEEYEAAAKEFIAKQFEIITLITLRSFFHDIASNTNIWFMIMHG